jgi:hypothetical protein
LNDKIADDDAYRSPPGKLDGQGPVRLRIELFPGQDLSVRPELSPELPVSQVEPPPLRIDLVDSFRGRRFVRLRDWTFPV